MEDDRVVLCQAQVQSTKDVEWIEMHEKLKAVTQKFGVKEVGHRVAGGLEGDVEQERVF